MIAKRVGREYVEAELVRRNVVVEASSVLVGRSALFRIGDAVVRGTGAREPCSKMGRTLGTGGHDAPRGHGGIVACVVRCAAIAVGNRVHFAEDQEMQVPLFR